ncbi:unnamed protein product [Linum tenue]|uniref:HMA domain-containing protein n=1 Tax=Linum tenue TaxID=586396 RepID=A0AAV0R3B5_9ROSI|nr:unnamed protein product [Linum tenue]
MKQKLVIKVSMSKEKSRSKAMTIVVGVHGVDSAALAGPEKTQIEVTGDGIDSVSLVTLLRSKVGFAELVSVGPVEEKKKEEDKKKTEEDSKPPPAPVVWSYGYAAGPPHHYVYQTSSAAGGHYYNDNDPSCAIM